MNLFEREKQWLLDEKYNGVETKDFLSDLEKLQSGTPLAYLIGNQPFLGAIIELDSKPLIPRPETEYWVNKIIKEEIQEKNLEILDIFSGSGCVGVGILYNTKNTHVDFGELKSEHVEQIRKNLKLNNIDSNRFEIFQSDVFEKIPDKQYDIILANPPYISHERKDTVQDSVINYEDHDALFAENEGLFFVEKLIQESKQFLKPDGKVFVEFDPWQTELIEKLCEQHNISKYSFIKDQYNKPRVFTFTY